MKEKFQEWNPTSKSLQLLEVCDQIIVEYQRQGYDLSLRQLYYQLVSRDVIPNRDNEYKKIVSLIGNGRLAGLIDWAAIDDRVRSTNAISTWDHPGQILESAAYSFALDLWENQPWHVEVMVEKDALSGVLWPVCRSQRVRFTANRGYSSLSHLYRIGKRLRRAWKSGKEIQVIYFGDHDPSGIDMDRDLEERLGQFSGGAPIEFIRAALLISQVEQYNPPPNPAKLTDTRAKAYISQFGKVSWELDALEPTILAKLVEDYIESLIDWDQWQEDYEREQEMIQRLNDLAQEWQEE